jgi:hypothetical protein
MTPPLPVITGVGKTSYYILQQNQTMGYDRHRELRARADSTGDLAWSSPQSQGSLGEIKAGMVSDQFPPHGHAIEVVFLIGREVGWSADKLLFLALMMGYLHILPSLISFSKAVSKTFG